MLLKEFSLTHQCTNEEQIAQVRLLNKEDFARFRALDDKIITSLEDKNTYQASTDEFVQNCIEQIKGFCTGCFVNERLIAYCMTFIPGDSPKNLGLDLEIPKRLLPTVVHLDSVGVLPAFRGNGIQQICMEINNQIALQRGYSLIFTTVHPHNIASLRSFTKTKWTIVKIKKKYGGKWRCILQYLPERDQELDKSSTENRVISNRNIIDSQGLIESGYIGVEALKDGTIRYERVTIDYDHIAQQ